MAVSNPLTISNQGFLGTGTNYQYNPTAYNPYQAYTPYSSALGSQARDNLSQMMSGTLSDSTNQILQNQFKQNLAATREGAYGMPLGAQMGLETKAASENALSAAQLAEQQRNFAIQNTLGYEQMAQGDKQYGYGQGISENRYGQEWDQKQRDQMANYSAQSTQGLNFGNLLGAGVSALTGGFAGRLGGGFANNLLGSNDLGNGANPYLSNSVQDYNFQLGR